jgi:hypothetical protein
MAQSIGNIVPDDVPVSDNEDHNAIVRLNALDKVLPAELAAKEYKVCVVPSLRAIQRPYYASPVTFFPT